MFFNNDLSFWWTFYFCWLTLVQCYILAVLSWGNAARPSFVFDLYIHYLNKKIIIAWLFPGLVAWVYFCEKKNLLKNELLLYVLWLWPLPLVCFYYRQEVASFSLRWWHMSCSLGRFQVLLMKRTLFIHFYLYSDVSLVTLFYRS